MAQETIILCTNRVFRKGELATVRRVAEENDAGFVRCTDRRVSNHTGWFTYKNIGHPFTTAVARDIREQLASLGIEL